MKTVLLILIYLLFTIGSSSQTRDSDKYYPENKLYRKLLVKSVIDTISNISGGHFKKEIDRLGRNTTWYYIEDSVRTHFQYEKKGDTLIRLHFNTVNGKKKPVYRFEKFLYNENGKILLYQSCNTMYGSRNQAPECEMSKFYYDDKGRLLTQLDYYENNYNTEFSENMILSESLMRLVDVNVFSYHKNNKLIVKKQNLGRSETRRIDSFFYDNSNRLIKSIGFQEQGYLGEFAVLDLRQIELVEYQKDSTLITRFITYRDWEIKKVKRSEDETEVYIYEPNRLLKISYEQNRHGQKSMLFHYVYEFYPG